MDMSAVVAVRTIAQEMNMALPAASKLYGSLSQDAKIVVDRLCRRLNEEMFGYETGTEDVQ